MRRLLLMLLFYSCNQSDRNQNTNTGNYALADPGTILIQSVHKNGVKKQASGFIVKHPKGYYFITAYHVLTNRDAKTNELQDSNGEPEYIGFHLSEAGRDFPAKFYVKDKWLEYKESGSICDIVAVPFFPKEGIDFFATEIPLYYSLKIGDTCSVSGFPLSGQRSKVTTFNTTVKYLGVEGIKCPTFVLRATGFSGGFSGGPVYTRSGIVGVVSHMYIDDKTKDTGEVIYRAEIIDRVISNGQIRH